MKWVVLSRQKKRELRYSQGALLHLFRLLGDETRFQIVHLLAKGQGDVCVGALARMLRVTPSAISQHLRVLELGGVVERVRAGKNICYVVKKESPYMSVVLPLMFKRPAVARH